jgi:TPR repeat protein
MKYLDISSLESAALGAPNARGDIFVQLGLMYSTGRTVPADRVAAHKWFNLAAFKGHNEAAQLRKELAAEMSEDDIAEAQRAARQWVSTH